MNVQLHLIDDTPLARQYPRPPATPPARRQSDGKFAPVTLAASNTLTDSVAAAVVAGYFASVCKLMGLDRDAMLAVLASRAGHGSNFDPAFRRASYARQLAMYLTATEANVAQAQIARVTGLSDAAVHKALRAVEDLRDDHADYEELVTAVLVDIAMTEDSQALVGRARRLARRHNRKDQP
jgi:hypothetical protein